jgi:hypothetical protein
VAPFQYDRYQNPLVGSIAQLILEGPRAKAAAIESAAAAQAQGVRGAGAAMANMGQSLGAIAAGLPRQIAEAHAEQQRSELTQNALDDAARRGAADKMASTAMAGDQLPPGDVGPRQPSFIKQEGDVSVFDTDALSKHYAAAGYGDQLPRLMKDVDAVNQMHRQEGQARMQMRERTTNLLAAHAGLALQAIHAGMDPQAAVGAQVELIHLNGVVPDDQLSPIVQRMQANPDQIVPMLTSMSRAGTAKPIEVKAGTDLLNPNNPADVLASVPEKKADYTINGQRFSGTTNQPLGPPVPTQAAPKGLQSESEWKVDGKPRPLIFDPATGARYLSDADVAAKQPVDPARLTKIPPASVQINAANAAAASKPIETDSKEFRIAQDLAYGKLSFADFTRLYPSRSGASAQLRASLYDKARELNPGFDPTQFEIGRKFAMNPQMRQRLIAIDGLMPVIDKIEAVAAQVGNGDVTKFNELLNAAKLQVSNKPVANMHQLQILLGDEVGMALGLGSGSDLKTKLGLDLVNPNLSASTFADTMSTLRDVLGSRRQNLVGSMGIYAPGAPGAQPPAGGGAVTVTSPSGKPFTFPNQAAADAAVAAAKAQGVWK